MEHHTTTSRAEAERLLGIAEKLLRNKDFSGCRDFAILAQETEPLLEGSDQILAVAEVLLVSENKRLNNSQHDWYAVLQIPQRTDEAELIKKQYHRLALLLHPDKNKFPFSDSAFRLVADAWAVLSDPAKKPLYDNEFAARFTKVDLVSSRKQHQFQKKQPPPREENSNQKLPVRRSARGGGDSGGGGMKVNSKKSSGGGGNPGWSVNFWTACPYCYNLYEYPRVYDGCCVRCDNENCKRAFTCSEILSMPPMVPGREAYYCCWGFFPMGFTPGDGNVPQGGNAFPKWMPSMFGDRVNEEAGVAEDGGAPQPPRAPENVNVAGAAGGVDASSGKKKRGRPKKNL
ncbi:hypothetical protein BUALT_Bualt15G0124100 [Buddleja alternifolia]|uniref:J domain-containing protein n=1 Tax=Buddleja alternifolia TaxID=168488 RepID=A0AAV6WL83_9LAMI|nr:hypothetical protein BUALT_Bualt15G0124100 [Buddleja alternifolia]